VIQDLYYRLNVIPLEIPALKARIDDIEQLLKHFNEHFAKQHSRTAPKFSKQAIKILQNYEWPGNVRELRNLCERTSVLLSGQVIEAENFPQSIIQIFPEISCLNLLLQVAVSCRDDTDIDGIRDSVSNG
jgi:DNA-binding NtrC family response regulator